jgi:DNA repair photolyase
MWSEKKFGLTAELLKILKFYRYPYIVFTRSDLVADDSYLKLLDPNLAAIQFSISSTNEELSRKIEPGAPSPRRRLAALSKLAANGLWTTVRVNPFFPIYPDGYFSDPEFKWEGNAPKFPFSSFEMIDEIAAANVPAVLVGFVRLSSYAINNIQRSTGFNLRPFYRKDIINKSPRDFHFSDSEIRAYYKAIKNRCIENGLEFSTCYIGNGESHFWRDQDLWTNNKDCCNAKGRVDAFENDCRQIPFTTRLKFSGKKDILPLTDRLHASLGRLPERPSPERRPPEISL